MVSDDIVTRLRQGCFRAVHNEFGNCSKCEAADEIERLRQLVLLWKRAAKNWRGVAYGGGTTNVEDARDAYTAAEEADLAG